MQCLCPVSSSTDTRRSASERLLLDDSVQNDASVSHETHSISVCRQAQAVLLRRAACFSASYCVKAWLAQLHQKVHLVADNFCAQAVSAKKVCLWSADYIKQGCAKLPQKLKCNCAQQGENTPLIKRPVQA